MIWGIHKEAFHAFSLNFSVTHGFKKEVNCCKPGENLVFGMAYPKDRERRHRAHVILQGFMLWRDQFPYTSEYRQLHSPCMCLPWWWKERGSSRSILCALTTVLTSVDGVEITVLQTWNGRRHALNWSRSSETSNPQALHIYWRLLCVFLQGTPLMLLEISWNQSQEDAVRCQHH